MEQPSNARISAYQTDASEHEIEWLQLQTRGNTLRLCDSSKGFLHLNKFRCNKALRDLVSAQKVVAERNAAIVTDSGSRSRQVLRKFQDPVQKLQNTWLVPLPPGLLRFQKQSLQRGIAAAVVARFRN
jgi:hypothetical protein